MNLERPQPDAQTAYRVLVFPSRAALNQRLEQDLAASPSRVILRPHYHTFDSLLPTVLADVPLPGERRPLSSLAGPLLVQELVREHRESGGPLSGVALGRRLPDRLWRLLVEIKAAGLGPDDIRQINDSGQMGTLASLLSRYDEALMRLGLEDQADLIARAERLIAQGQGLAILRSWAGLEAFGVLWLRALDFRLVRLLSRALPVTIRFSVTPQNDDPLYNLCRVTADFLEAAESGAPQAGGLGINIVWEDFAKIKEPGRPLAGLMSSMLLRPGGDYGEAGDYPLRMIKESGRYTEVEALVHRARDLMDQGVQASEIAIVFPDLDLYGQMARDVARRVGLPLSSPAGEPLAESPLVLALLALLELGLGDKLAGQVARVFDSPYLSGPLARWLLGEGAPAFENTATLLRTAGYIDAREGGITRKFQAAAKARPRLAEKLLSLGRAIESLGDRLGGIKRETSLIKYLQNTLDMVAELDPLPRGPGADGGGKGFPAGAMLRVRELMALAGFKQCLQELLLAAEQTGAGEGMSAGRCLALLHQALGRADLRPMRSARQGVRLLRLQDAAELRLHSVLMGGLTQSGFPIPPQSQNFISSSDRRRLGGKAKMPVWRTEDEEYSAQVIRLAWLLSRVEGGAVLSFPAAGPDGREEEPAFIFNDLARGLKITPPPPMGGAFGGMTPLEDCRDGASLWAGLARVLLHQGGGVSEKALAPALLGLLIGSGHEPVWRSIKERAQRERKRHELDYMAVGSRFDFSDAFSGRIASGPALNLLRAVLGRERMRTLSPTSLEGLAACPMLWFCGWVLGLEEPDTLGWEIGGREEGDWVHAALARFFNPAEFRADWGQDQIEARLVKCVEQARDDLLAKGRMGHPSLWKAREPVVREALKGVVARELEEMGGCRPRAVEASFDKDGHDLRVPLAGSGPLLIRGRLDRLDACEGEIRVTDYKHTRNPQTLKQATDEDALGVSAFQLPVYLAAARDMLGDKYEMIARLVPTRLTGKKVGVLQYSPDDLFLAPMQRPGQYEPGQNLFAAIAALWQRGLDGDFTPHPAPETCEYCGLQGLCRARVTGAAGEEA